MYLLNIFHYEVFYFGKRRRKTHILNSKIISNKLYLLSNPIDNKCIKIEATCNDGNIFDLMNVMNVDAFTFTYNPTKRILSSLIQDIYQWINNEPYVLVSV